MSRKAVFSLSLSGLLSAAALFLAFRNVPLADLATYFISIDYWWFIPSASLIIAAFILRVYRWRMILQGSLAIGFRKAYHPLMISFMMNCVLPGRVGEIARPVLLRRQHGLPLSTGLATVAAERVFDMILLIALFGAVFGTLKGRPEVHATFGGIHLDSQMLQTAAWTMIRIGIVLLVSLGLISFSLTRRGIVRTIEVVIAGIGGLHPQVRKYVQRAGNFSIHMLNNFASGLDLLGQPGRLLGCFGLTVMIWALTLLSYFVFAFGCPGLQISLVQMTTVMVVICFFIALPSVPGYWGLWEAGGIFALSLFGVSAKDAAGFTLVNHALQLFLVIVLGLISALLTSVNFWKLNYDEKKPVPHGISY